MQSDIQPITPASKKMVWSGRVLSALLVLMILASGIAKLLKAAAVIEGFKKFGYLDNHVLPLGIVEVACAVLYAIPRTAVLGAILLTGYLGGATATHLRIGEPFFAPVLLGMVVWLGLFLRDARLRALLPLRR